MYLKIMGVVGIKIIRRSIIVICLLLFIPVISESLPESRYNDKNIADKTDQVYKVNQSVKIDMDTLIIKSIIITPDETRVWYRILKPEQGWSFPQGAIKMYDEKGNSYIYEGGTGSGRLWGEDYIDSYQRISGSSNEIILKYEWYDRYAEFRIPLKKSGGSNE